MTRYSPMAPPGKSSAFEGNSQLGLSWENLALADHPMQSYKQQERKRDQLKINAVAQVPQNIDLVSPTCKRASQKNSDVSDC